MKRFFGFVFILSALLCVFSVPSYAVEHIKTIPEIVFEDKTVHFSPDGVNVSAVCSQSELQDKLRYFAIDAATSTPVTLPLVNVGTYNVVVRFDGDAKYEAEECAATITILPVNASIVTPYHTAAYTAMDNPLEYTVEPAWTADYLEISVEYFPIDDVASISDEAVECPKELGKYYTKINAVSKNGSVICDRKQLVYEIAPSRGARLSAEEAKAPVPRWFKCEIEKLSTPYAPGEHIVPKYNVTPSMAEYSLMYRVISFTDVQYEYTASVPSEPGDYEVVCFASGCNIGSGTLSIEKLVPEISITDQNYSYSSDGIYPKANLISPDGMAIRYTAYPVEADGTVSITSVSLPLKVCGKYLIIASPEDTVHYKSTFSYSYLTITPIEVKIDETKQTFTFDGTPKNVAVKLEPDWVKYKVEYFRLLDNGEMGKALMDTLPCEEGRYLACVTVDEENGSVNSNVTFIEMYIARGAGAPVDIEGNGGLVGTPSTWLLVLIIVPSLIIIILGTVLLVRLKKE